MCQHRGDAMWRDSLPLSPSVQSDGECEVEERCARWEWRCRQHLIEDEAGRSIERCSRRQREAPTHRPAEREEEHSVHSLSAASLRRYALRRGGLVEAA